MEPVELRPLKSIWIRDKDHYMERKRPDFVSEDSWGSRGREFKSRHSDQSEKTAERLSFCFGVGWFRELTASIVIRRMRVAERSAATREFKSRHSDQKNPQTRKILRIFYNLF